MASRALVQERGSFELANRSRSEKDERLLAGRVAHDLRNILQIISGNLTLLAKKVGDDETALRHIDRAMAGIDLGAELTGAVLGKVTNPLTGRVTCIVTARDTIEAILKEASGPSIEVTVATPSEPCAVAVNQAELENVLINLALNARDAMGEVGSLRVTFASDPDPTRQWVTMSVSDTGCGMPPRLIERIFDPYFTTKGTNGSGLGLATVRRFAEECGGAISVESSPGQGTSFFLRMPLASA